jgi:hypothetical protein
VKHEAAKNILDDIFTWGGGKIEARRKQNHNERLCLGRSTKDRYSLPLPLRRDSGMGVSSWTKSTLKMRSKMQNPGLNLLKKSSTISSNSEIMNNTRRCKHVQPLTSNFANHARVCVASGVELLQ